MKLSGSDNGCYVNYSNSFLSNYFRIVWRGVRFVSDRFRNIPLIIAHRSPPFATFFQFIYTVAQLPTQGHEVAQQLRNLMQGWGSGWGRWDGWQRHTQHLSPVQITRHYSETE